MATSRKQTSSRLTDSGFGILCTVPGLIVLLALVAYPIGYNIILSFMSYKQLVFAGFVGFRNYAWFFSSKNFHLSWRISALYSTGSAGLAFLAGMILAHCLSAVRRGRAVFRTLVILSWAIPPVLSGLIWKWIMNKDMGLTNYVLSFFSIIKSNIPFLADTKLAILSAMVATAYVYIPFMTVFINAGLETIPPELYEVASIDGADEFHKFFYISVPLNKKQMLFSFIVVWMFTFRTPDVIFALTRGGPGKATYHAGLFLVDLIYSYIDFGRAAVVSVMLFLSVGLVVTPLAFYIFRRSE
jgi:multiple sugar transport system permease protein